MADDEFDIDIYGDANTGQETDTNVYKKEEDSDTKIDARALNSHKGVGEQEDDYVDINVNSLNQDKQNVQQKIKSTDESGQGTLNIPKQAPRQQGVKRKDGSDDRPIDSGATTALLISELNWWNTDDDIRGWINQAQVEDELKEITFSEHKVNGKSKGQAWVEFTSQQAATAAKRKIDAFGEGQQYVKKHIVTFSNPNVNPFRTLPKDAPLRAGKDNQTNRMPSGSYNNERGNQGGSFGGNFRGRTSGYSARGMNNGNGFNNFNRNFSGTSMGNMGAGFNNPMSGFTGNPMSNQFSGFNNRGGMMGNIRGGTGMRGGRGSMGNGMMGSMPMGGLQMGGMPAMGGIPMNMGNMAGGMPGAGFQAMQPHFNPAFFQSNQAAGGEWQNPHGVKRPRPE
ncbi:putative rrm domain-containing protein [Golovinomyces cichoracearum]|uniref:Putative rrm domain-containing protein n=1 Tax=Golovinomyces cichoracearum TaxID=62708 RepID=A0A420IYN8_9PEZI|nr:putative rrm domain-containing protein [Golovinomyces cichoracearum]